MIENPLVSVIMNCHNGETYLKESISSLISQTYKNWELIFWDNFSSDSSKEVLMQFQTKGSNIITQKILPPFMRQEI